MRYCRQGLLFLLLAIMVGSAGAATLTQQRAAFEAIVGDMQSGNLDGVPQRIQSLKGYVLYPYLRYAYLKTRLKQGDQVDAQIQHFLKRWKQLPVADQLRDIWLRQLVQRRDWQRLEAHYQPTSDPHLRCDIVAAELKTDQGHGRKPGSDEKLVSDAMNLWMTGRDQPKACHPVFKWLKSSGRLTPGRYQTRVDLALKQNHIRLASYLARRQTGAARKRTLQRIAVQRHPAQALKKLSKNHDNSIQAATIVEGLSDLAFDRPKQAAKLYQPLAAGYNLSATQRKAVQRKIALGFAVNHQSQASDWLSRLSGTQVNSTVRAWRIRTALYHRNWQGAMKWLDKLPSGEAASPKWRYWRARVLAKQGKTDQAHRIYRQLAEEDGYYAWLAASRLGERYHPHSRVVALNPDTLRQLKKNPAIIRARELYMVGWYKEARDEWRQALLGKPPAIWRQAGVLAQQWGWHSEAIIALANGGMHQDLSVSYPMAFSKQVLLQSRKHALNAAWLYGIIRTESLFMPDAHSYAGARGLMQLLPGTAREVARRNGIVLSDADTLYDTGMNVRLGSHYLKRLLARFNGNLVLATAAYNAGPHKVVRWLPDKALPADIWVENIPYVQTRHYVKSVLGHTIMFEWRLRHNIAPAVNRMPPIGTVKRADMRTDSG